MGASLAGVWGVATDELTYLLPLQQRQDRTSRSIRLPTLRTAVHSLGTLRPRLPAIHSLAQATFHCKEALEFGTKLVGGVSPKKAGTEHLGLPVFGSVREVRSHVRAISSRDCVEC